MKADIHPKYFGSIVIRCACGNLIHAGSTQETLKTELCSACHPFYTGKQKLLDTAGRVDKFEARRKSAVVFKEAQAQAENEKKLRRMGELETHPAAKKSPKKEVTAPKSETIKTAKKSVTKVKKVVTKGAKKA